VSVGLLAVSGKMWLIDMPLVVDSWDVATMSGELLGLNGMPNPYGLSEREDFDAILLCAEWCKWLDATAGTRRASVLQTLRKRSKVLAAIDGHDGFALALPAHWFDQVDVVLKGQGLFRDRDLYNYRIGPRYGPGSRPSTASRRRSQYTAQQLDKLRLAPPVFLHVDPGFRAAVRRVKPDWGRAMTEARNLADRAVEALVSCERRFVRARPESVFYGTLTSLDRLQLVSEAGRHQLAGDWRITAVPELIYGTEMEQRDSPTPQDLEETDMRIAPPDPRYGRTQPYTATMDGIPLRTVITERESIADGLRARDLLGPPLSRPALRRRLLRFAQAFAPAGYGELTVRHGEALASRRVLVCQNLSHVETQFPFRDRMNVVYCRPDFKDVDVITTELSQDSALCRTVGRAGYVTWRDWSRGWRRLLDDGLAAPIRAALGDP
jgi:hypothetical protein